MERGVAPVPKRSTVLVVLLAVLIGSGMPLVARAQSGSYLPGIDVSRWQGTIDWGQVAGDGISFVFMKATDGTTIVDPAYQTNLAEARANGVQVGSYHFARPDGSAGDARLEAQWFVANASIEAGGLPPVLDIEVNGGLGQVALTDWALTWLEEVRALTGARGLVYTSPNGWKERFGSTPRIANAGYDLWVAHWTTGAPMLPANDWGGRGWQVWQYTDCGRIAGIGGCVDRDWFNGTNLDAITLRGLEVTSQGTGSGTVAGSDVGLDCGDACTRVLNAGTPVTLTASAPPGSYFDGWSGACRNAEGDCTTAMTANRSVVATFIADSEPPTASATGPREVGGEVVVRFSEPVSGVADGNVVLRRKGGAVVRGLRTCVAPDGSGEVDCATGRVGEVRILPDAMLVEGAAYAVTVGAGGAIVDRAQNPLAKTTLEFLAPVTVDAEEADPAVVASWPVVRSTVAAGGSYVMERAAGATATYRFSGPTIRWRTIVGPSMGIAQVTIDGRKVGTFDGYAGSTAARERAFKNLGSGEHVLTIRVMGKRSGSARDTYVAIDAFTVGAQTVAAPKLAVTWRTATSPLASGGRWTLSNATNAAIVYRFSGPTVIWSTQVGPDQGKAKVFVEGKLIATVDLYAAEAAATFRVFGGFGAGTHTVRIVVSGTSASASRGTWVTVDGFSVP